MYKDYDHATLKDNEESDSSVQQTYYSRLVQNKRFAVISDFTLESGTTIERAQVAYSTFGTLNNCGDNALVVCHALTGSSDVADWWQPLLGGGKALDPTRYFIFCANVLGSPYGTSSPLDIDPITGVRYGPTFPGTTIRDDVKIQKLVLDALGVKSVAVVIGGSMGGMHTLEWPLCTPQDYVRNIVTIATSAYQGAWGISWSETQTQAIITDAAFDRGWFDPRPAGQPRSGLGLARMIGMLTYRSADSFETRFGRSVKVRKTATAMSSVIAQTSELPLTPPNSEEEVLSQEVYSAQSYLMYQAVKFLDRFDANCYLHLIRKINTHDVTRGRGHLGETTGSPNPETLKSVLASIPDGALVVGVQNDLLFPLSHQTLLADCLPGARLFTLASTDGHDGFLIEFEKLNVLILEHLQARCRWLYTELK